MLGEPGEIAVDGTVINHLEFGDSSHIILCPMCSALFPDVVNCMQTDNLELKKLVYLYLMNYAKSQPDMAIMAVNTFVKVTFCRVDDKFTFVKPHLKTFMQQL